MKKTNKKKLIQINDVVHISGTTYLYALAKDGCVYFMSHKPETNDTIWQKLPSPSPLNK